jgi:hypothetical protein
MERMFTFFFPTCIHRKYLLKVIAVSAIDQIIMVYEKYLKSYIWGMDKDGGT